MLLPNKTKMVWIFIADYKNLYGYSPSYKEIAEGVGFSSKSGVSRHINRLINEGLITNIEGIPRSLNLIKFPSSKYREFEKSISLIPYLGEIRAGNLTLVEESIKGYLQFNQSIQEGFYALKVVGDSMNLSGFIEGDYVIVKPQNSANNGDIVVALDPYEDRATLKKYRIVDGYNALIPNSSNPEYKPIISKEIVIRGVVSNLVKKRDAQVRYL